MWRFPRGRTLTRAVQSTRDPKYVVVPPARTAGARTAGGGELTGTIGGSVEVNRQLIADNAALAAETAVAYAQLENA